MKIATVILFTDDLPRMCAFYRDVLGLAELTDGSVEGFQRFDAGGCTLALHALPAQHVTQHGDAPAPRRSDSYFKVAYRADDVEVMRHRLVAQGARMDEPTHFGELVFCDGVDPEGNVFQISNR